MCEYKVWKSQRSDKWKNEIKDEVIKRWKQSKYNIIKF